MPHNPIDYSKTIMYKLVCKDLSINELYVGHTTDFKTRKNSHKNNCNNINDSKKYNINVYQFIRENGNWDNWDMIKIEDYPCLTKLDAEKRERELIEALNAILNSNIPSRTKKEYNKDNRELILEYKKEYRENNQDKIKEYRENNQDKIKEKFICDCGGRFTYSHKSRHLKSQSHLNYLASLPAMVGNCDETSSDSIS